MSRHGLPGLCALLILLATAAFVIGVTVEDPGHSESVEQTQSEPETQVERSDAHEGGGEAGEEATSPGQGSETVLGMDVESTPIIVLAAVVSLAVAGVVLKWPRREVLAAAAAFCLGFAVLDAREVAHQVDEEARAVAALAALALVMHLLAAVVAIWALLRQQQAVAD